MNDVNQKTEEKGEDLFSYLLFRFAPYWPLFIILFVIAGVAGWIYIKKATPLYEAKATIMLKDERKGVDDAEMLEALNVYASKKIVENELEVIKSRTLMKQVVERLHIYAPVYKVGGFRDENLYGYAPLRIESKNPMSLYSTDEIYFTINKGKGSVNIDGIDYTAGTWQQTPYGELRFGIDSQYAPDPQELYYFRLYNSEVYAGALKNGISIKPSNKTSTVLNIALTDESPLRSRDVLNELIADYERRTISDKNALAANTLVFIEDRLSHLVRELDSIEHTIQAYKSKQGIVNLSEQGRMFLNNVGDNDRQIGNINMQLAVLDQVEKYVLSKNIKGGLVPSTLGLTDQALSRLVQRLYDSELQYERLKQTMAENSPAVVAVANEISAVRPAILENVKNQKESLLASRNDLSSTSGQYTSVIRTIPQKERKLVEISREQSIKQNVYSFLLQKREETALSSSSTVADSRLIDPAAASWNPVSPEAINIYFGAFLAALVFGVAIVLGKELLPGKILFRSDIEKYSKVPIAGEITSVKHKGDLVINHSNKLFVSEQFRQLRASIGLYGRVVRKQKMLITSSIAGEGKSFIASNLAVSLSLSGKRVVLVDADFRSPKTTSIFNLKNEKGFVDYLQGEADLHSIIRSTSYNNLFVIPAGNATPNPTELLLYGDLNTFFEDLTDDFDFILVDTSPVAPVTDAYVFSDYCDKTLFVIRHGYTPKTMVKILDENSKIKALKNMFIVFNGVKKRGFINGTYGFGYGFGYEYVYKERDNMRKK